MTGEGNEPSARDVRTQKLAAFAERTGSRRIIQPKRFFRSPATYLLLLLLWLPGLIAGALLHGPTADLRRVVALTANSLAANPLSLVTSGFWARDLSAYLLWTAGILIIGWFAEYRLGSWRTLAAAAASQIVGAFAAIAVVQGGRGVMGDWGIQLFRFSYIGPSAFILGVAAAATATVGPLWRRRYRVALFTLLGLLVLYSGTFPDLVRFSAAVVGGLLGPLLCRRRPTVQLPAVSRREARVLLALIMAASAIGPVIAGFLPHAIGPLSILKLLFTNLQAVTPETLQTLCSAPARFRECQGARLQLRAGAGGLFMAILPSILILVISDGLRRGRRFAWIAAVVLQSFMALIALLLIVTVFGLRLPGDFQVDHAQGFQLPQHAHPMPLVIPLLLPVLLLILLIMSKGLFTIPAPPGTYRRIGRTLCATALTLSVLYVIVGLILADQFNPAPNLWDLIADVPNRFLPLGYTVELAPAFFPEGLMATVLYEAVGIIFWAVASWLMLRSFIRPAFRPQAEDLERAKAILTSTGGSTMSWMTLWDGNHYWFSSTGRSYVAYRVHLDIALVLGPPVGPRDELAATIDEFAHYAADNQWAPCFYSVDDDVRALTDARQWHSVQVAQETILDLDGLTFAGKKFQDIRTAQNRAKKEGIRPVWVTYADAPLSILDQIHAISEEWVADKHMPEMGFTLGGLDEMIPPEVRVLVAVDETNTVHAVASWMPVYENGEIVGWTLDFMRRRASGFRAGIEYIIAAAALDFKKDGYRFLSLSGAPLARVEDVDPDAVPDEVEGARTLNRLLDRMATLLEPVYGFKSLLKFKAKFQPRYVPLYMTYSDVAALPRIANAVGRAYLPDVSLREGITLVRKLVRAPSDTKDTSTPPAPPAAERIPES